MFMKFTDATHSSDILSCKDKTNEMEARNNWNNSHQTEERKKMMMMMQLVSALCHCSVKVKQKSLFLAEVLQSSFRTITRAVCPWFSDEVTPLVIRLLEFPHWTFKTNRDQQFLCPQV